MACKIFDACETFGEAGSEASLEHVLHSDSFLPWAACGPWLQHSPLAPVFQEGIFKQYDKERDAWAWRDAGFVLPVFRTASQLSSQGAVSP